jgi:hypothetical protein
VPPLLRHLGAFSFGVTRDVRVNYDLLPSSENFEKVWKCTSTKRLSVHPTVKHVN